MTPDGKPQGITYADGKKWYACIAVNDENKTIPGRVDEEGNCYYPYCGE